MADTIYIDATTFPSIQDAINAAIQSIAAQPVAVILPPGNTNVSAEIQIPPLASSLPMTLLGRRNRGIDQTAGTSLTATAPMRSVLAMLSAQNRMQDILINAAGQATYGLYLQNVYDSQFDNVTVENAITDGWFFTSTDATTGKPTNNDSVLMTNCWAQANGTTYATSSLQSEYSILPYGTLKTIAGTASISAGNATIGFAGAPDLTTLGMRTGDFVRVGNPANTAFFGRIASVTSNTITVQSSVVPQQSLNGQPYALFIGFGVNLSEAADNNILVVTGGEYRFSAATNFNVQGLFGSTFIGPQFTGGYVAGFSVSRNSGTSIGQGTMLQNCYFEENQAAEVWTDNYTDVTIVSPMFESINPPYWIRPHVLTATPAQGVVVANGLRSVLPSGTEQHFVFELRNDNGTLQHRFVSDVLTNGAPAGASQIDGAVNTWTTTPKVGPSTGLMAGAGIAQNLITFDTADQPSAPWFLPPMASVEFCSFGTQRPGVFVSQQSSDINGITATRLVLGFVTASGQPFALNTSNIVPGTSIAIRLGGGYIRGIFPNPLTPT